jgi:pimeloyl-ACP methyl ester carboxylesterase
MSTFVLVHGAFHGGWCWHKIVSRLEAEGHTVFAPDMPGRGIDRTPLGDVTLESIVVKIGAVIDAAREPVILVGHSYGGTIITQTAETRAKKIRRLVYLTAFMVGDGEKTIDIAQADRENDLAGNIAFSEDGKSVSVNEPAIRNAFYASVPRRGHRTRQAVALAGSNGGFTTALRTTASGWGSIPRVYIECLKDRAISIGQQRGFHAKYPCDVHTLDTDHSPFFSMPDQLTDILVRL